MHKKVIYYLAEYWPTLLATIVCLAAVFAWLGHFSTAVNVRPMLEQPGVVPFYTTRPASPNPQFGMAVGNTLLGLTDDQLQRRLDDLNYIGVQWIRFDFGWDNIQPKNAESYSWAAHDRIVRAARQHNLKILGILTYSPAWAREPACATEAPNAAARQKCAPARAADFARFAGMAAARYPQVAAWEVWNEPNITGFWRQIFPENRVGVDPVRYATLVNLSAAAIKRQQPHAKVLSGGLAHVVNADDSQGMQTLQYLKAMVPLLDRNAIDGISFHPYTFPALPIAPEAWNAYYTLTDGPQESNMHYILVVAGWEQALLWATEFGASTQGVKQQANTPSNAPVTLQQYDHVSEDMQVEIMQKAIVGWCRKPQVGPLFLYTDSDQYTSSNRGVESGFGLRRSDGSYKPAYEATRAAIAIAKQSCK